MAKNLNQEPSHFVKPKHVVEGDLDGTGLNIGIVCAEFNQQITKALLMGAMEGLTQHGVHEDNIKTFMVPGAFEVPVVMDHVFPMVDCIIAIACVIQGDTPHFDYVCRGITDGITHSVHKYKKLGVFCVLTTDNEEQAKERSVPHSKQNKGFEAALTAITTANLIKNIKCL